MNQSNIALLQLTKSCVLPLRRLLLAGWVVLPALASAGTFVKTNNTANLNTAAAWTNNAVPGAADIAQWDATVSDVNNTTNTLGANLSWAGVKIINPAGNILLNAGNTLTNGANGIDMTAATMDLSLSNTVFIAPGALQQWNVASGRKLTLQTYPVKPGLTANVSGVLQIGTAGTVQIMTTNGINGATTTLGVMYDNQNNPFVTYGPNDWAALSAGQVVAATYTASTSSGLTAGANNDIVNDYGGGTGSAVDMASLRFNDPTFRTWNVANSGTSRTMTARGILVTANSGGGRIGGSVASSFLRPNRVTTGTSTSFNIIQNSPADFTIAVNISNPNSQTTRVVKSGPGNLILATPGYGSGGTEINGGTVTVAAGATLGSGGVTVNNTGRLVINASNTTFVASVSVNGGATNAINVIAANAQQSILGAAFNAGSTACEFNFANGVSPSTTTAPLLVSNVTANGAITVNVYCGSPVVGIFPLIKYTNSLAGTGFPAFSLGLMPLRATGYLSNDTANTSIDLVITNIAEPLKWATGSGTWDIAGLSNWQDALGHSTTYQQANGFGDAVVFEDTVSVGNPIAVTLNASPIPATVTVNAAKNYTISGNGGIGGGTSLTKSGSGTLTLSTTNTFTGGLYLTNGIVNFSSVTNLGNGGINFVGGTLQYASGNADDVSVRGVWFGPGGGTIDDGGNTITFANPIGNSGTGGFTKTGIGSLTLTGTNKYFGNTIVANGTLALAASSYISNSAAIIVNSGAILDTASSGVGLTLAGSSAQIVAGKGTISGTVISSNGVITPGTNGVYGTLTFGNDLTLSGGSLVMDVSTTNHDLIAVGGNLTLNSGSLLVVNSSIPLTNGVYRLMTCGGLAGGAGSVGNLTLSYSQAGKSAVLNGDTPGEVDLIIADAASDAISWSGTGASWDTTGSQNWLLLGVTTWAYTNGDAVTFDNLGTATPGVQLMASLTPRSIIVSNDLATYDLTDGTGTGGGKIAGSTGIVKTGAGTLILETVNVNSGALVISNGTVQIGNGAGGDLGSGNITNNAALVFAQGDATTHPVAGQISGTGSLTKQGTSTVILAANNTYAGPTTISAGTLQVGTGGAAGSLGSGAVTNDGTLVYNHTGTFAVGNIKTGPANGGAVTFSGAATVTLNGGNTYINNTTVNNGSVTLSAANVVPSSATVPGSTGWLAVDGTGTLDVNGFDHTVNALSGNNSAAVITNSANSATTTNLITVLGTGSTTVSATIAENTTGSKLALTLLGTSELRLAGNCAYSGPTLVASGATLGVNAGYVNGSGLTVLSNGATFYLDANSPSVSAGNAIFIPDNSAGTITSRNTANTLGNAATVSGGATATNIIGGTTTVSFNAPGAKQFQNLLGTVVVASGGSLRFSSTSLTVNGGDSTTFDVEGGLNTRNGTGSGAGISLGALVGAGTVAGAGNADGNGIYVIGAKGINATFSGTISGTPPRGTSIVKTGGGTQTLDGTLSYDGTTSVNNGVLAIASIANPGTSLDNSRLITLTSNAVLDVAARSDSTLNLGNSIQQTLAGYGVIRGSLLEAATTTNNLALGVMAVTNVATINGALNMQINRTNTPNCSQLSALSFVNGGAIVLTVANVGPTTLAGGDTFQLFNQAFTGDFVVTNLPALPSSQYYWTNKIAVNGSIQVVSLVNPNPPPIITSFNGTSLSLSWPTNSGWTLQAQTNTLSPGLVPSASGWVDIVPGSTGITSTNIAVDPTKPTVFFRLKL